MFWYVLTMAHVIISDNSDQAWPGQTRICRVLCGRCQCGCRAPAKSLRRVSRPTAALGSCLVVSWSLHKTSCENCSPIFMRLYFWLVFSWRIAIMVLAVCFFLKSPEWSAILGQSSRAIINCLFASNQTSRYQYSSPAAGGTCLTSCKSAMHLLHLCMGGFQVLTSARLLRSYNALLRVGRQQLATAIYSLYSRKKQFSILEEEDRRYEFLKHRSMDWEILQSYAIAFF